MPKITLKVNPEKDTPFKMGVMQARRHAPKLAPYCNEACPPPGALRSCWILTKGTETPYDFESYASYLRKKVGDDHPDVLKYLDTLEPRETPPLTGDYTVVILYNLYTRDYEYRCAPLIDGINSHGIGSGGSDIVAFSGVIRLQSGNLIAWNACSSTYAPIADEVREVSELTGWSLDLFPKDKKGELHVDGNLDKVAIIATDDNDRTPQPAQSEPALSSLPAKSPSRSSDDGDIESPGILRREDSSTPVSDLLRDLFLAPPCSTAESETAAADKQQALVAPEPQRAHSASIGKLMHTTTVPGGTQI